MSENQPPDSQTSQNPDQKLSRRKFMAKAAGLAAALAFGAGVVAYTREQGGNHTSKTNTPRLRPTPDTAEIERLTNEVLPPGETTQTLSPDKDGPAPTLTPKVGAPAKDVNQDV